MESRLSAASAKEHSSIKPFLRSPDIETVLDSLRKNSGSNRAEDRNSKGEIALNGIFSSQFGYEKNNSASFLDLEGGISLDAWNKNKLAGNFTFFSGNSSFPSHIDSSIKYSHVVPGTGTAHPSGNGFSYQYYSGYVSYSPNRVFNFQAGRDKHFWGDGYRSLFLSDISNSFPFLKISATVWKIKYVSLFAMMKDVTASPLKNDFRNKFGTFHYLSWHASKRINFSLFEAIIWQGTDDNRQRNFDVNYLNPVIFFRPVEYSLGSSDNSFLGASFKLKLGKKMHHQFYGQVILDEFLLSEVRAGKGWWANKQGLQLGYKSFDLIGVKNLSFRTEINAVRPYTYSHGSVQQNYGHYNQPLAHPLGANLKESVSILNYRYKKWMFETEFLYAAYGKNESGKNWGQNLFESYSTHPNEYGNFIGQGLKTNLAFAKMKVAYSLVPASEIMAEAGVAVREEKNDVASLSSTYFFIGIKAGIMNRYDDF